MRLSEFSAPNLWQNQKSQVGNVDAALTEQSNYESVWVKLKSLISNLDSVNTASQKPIRQSLQHGERNFGKLRGNTRKRLASQ